MMVLWGDLKDWRPELEELLQWMGKPQASHPLTVFRKPPALPRNCDCRAPPVLQPLSLAWSAARIPVSGPKVAESSCRRRGTKDRPPPLPSTGHPIPL